MWAGAVSFAFDKGGSSAAAGALQGLAGCLVDEVDVIAVNGDTGQAVGGGAIGDLGIAGGVGEGYLGGELVVFADEEHWQPPVGGQINALVEGTIGDGAVAEEGDADLFAVE